ncbi:MAG: aromatic-ring-hydroxylating dioxygenase subunit beta [Dehalococcoidia bacterium]
MTTAVTLSRPEAEAFLYKEARMLDNNQLYEWRDMMTQDITYWVPVNDEASDPLKHLSVIYDDWANLTGRIWRIIDSGLNHTQDPPSKMIRYVTNVEVEPAERDDEVTLHSCVWITTFKSGAQRVDDIDVRNYSTRQEHRLRLVDGQWKIAYKKVTLLNLNGHLNEMTHVI